METRHVLILGLFELTTLRYYWSHRPLSLTFLQAKYNWICPHCNQIFSFKTAHSFPTLISKHPNLGSDTSRNKPETYSLSPLVQFVYLSTEPNHISAFHLSHFSEYISFSTTKFPHNLGELASTPDLVDSWLSSYRLSLNSTKTKSYFIGTSQQHRKSNTHLEFLPIKHNNTNGQLDTVHILGI